jgi:hypothetical protein
LAKPRPVDDNISSRIVKLLPPSPQPMRYAIDEDAARLRAPAEAFLFAPENIQPDSGPGLTQKLLVRLNRMGIRCPLLIVAVGSITVIKERRRPHSFFSEQRMII